MSAINDLPEVRGQLLRGETLAPFTWFRVGGPADWLFLPADAEDLAQFLRALPGSVPVLPIGVGSNLIVRDGGFDGVVIRLAGRAFAQSEALPGNRLRAGAGALDSMQLDAEKLRAGDFDHATIEIWRVNWQDVAQRVLLRKGHLGEVTHGGSMWGHDRLWMGEERRKTANEVRRKTILSGLGAPLQVTRGQYKEVE